MADTQDKKLQSDVLPAKKHIWAKLVLRIFLIALILGGAYVWWLNPSSLDELAQKVRVWFEPRPAQQQEQPIDETASLRQEIQDLRVQIALLQKLQSQMQPVNTEMLEKRFETLEKFNKNVIDSKADLAIVLGMLTRLDKNEQKIETLSKITDQGAVALTAAMLVKDAAERGGSFVYEAEILNQLTGDEPSLKNAVEVIKKAAIEGVSNQAYLMASFDDVYPQLVEKYTKENEKSWKDRINNKISKFIKVKKNGKIAPEDAFLQNLGEINILINSGNIKKALLLLSQISDKSLQNDEILKDWTVKAQQKVAFDEAVSQISTYYLAALKVNFIKKETQHD